jgi:hypothetical protein
MISKNHKVNGEQTMIVIVKKTNNVVSFEYIGDKLQEDLFRNCGSDLLRELEKVVYKY